MMETASVGTYGCVVISLSISPVCWLLVFCVYLLDFVFGGGCSFAFFSPSSPLFAPPDLSRDSLFSSFLLRLGC